MPYGQDYSSGYGAGQGLGAIGGGLSAGLRNAIQYNREKQQAEKEQKALAYEQDPKNPNNILKMAQVNALNNTKNSTVDGGLLDPRLKGVALPIEQALPYIIAKMGKAAPAANTPFVKMSPEDQKDVKAIEQGMTNLKQVEEQYKATKAGSHGVQGTVASWAPWLAKLPQFQNATPDLTSYNQATHEAANAYARAAFGRVSNELINQSQELMPHAGVDAGIAQSKLNELANTMKGKANSIAARYRLAGDPATADALEQRFKDQWGNMRFFPELDEGKTAGPTGPGQVNTNFEGAPDVVPASIAAASAAQAPAAAAIAPPAPAKSAAFDPDAFAAQVLARRAALKGPAAQKAPGAR